MATLLKSSPLSKLSSHTPLNLTTQRISAIRSFHQAPPLAQHPRPQHPSPQQGKPNENPSYPAFNFSDLGANRAVKMTVYTVIGILGTMETIFWTKATWRYFKGEEASPGD